MGPTDTFPFSVEYWQDGDWKQMSSSNLRIAVSFLKYAASGACFHGKDPTLFIQRHRPGRVEAFHCDGDGVAPIHRHPHVLVERTPLMHATTA
ncbi:MAG: hypothetical protein NVS1B14_03750 [Vulcanimicrobiaceae bacterium]